MNYLGDNSIYILIIFGVFVGLVPQAAEFDLISNSMLCQWHIWLASEWLLSEC